MWVVQTIVNTDQGCLTSKIEKLTPSVDKFVYRHQKHCLDKYSLGQGTLFRFENY